MRRSVGANRLLCGALLILAAALPNARAQDSYPNRPIRIVVPIGTPKPIVKRLNAELVKVVNLPDVKERFQGQGLTAVGSTPEQMSALIKEESMQVAKLVKQIGYKPQ